MGIFRKCLCASACLFLAHIMMPATSFAESGDDLPKALDRAVSETTIDKAEIPAAANTGSYVLSLDDCTRMALERNRRLIAAGYDIEAAEGQLQEANAAYWPVFEYKYRMAPVPNDVSDAFNKFFEGELTFFNSIHFGMGVPLNSFGQLTEVKKLAKGGVEAAKIKEEGLRYDTIFQVKKIYFGILMAKQTINLLEEASSQMTSKIEREEEKEEKEMDPYDLLQLRSFRAELEKRLAEANHNLSLAYEGLKIQLDIDRQAAVEIKDSTLSPLLQELQSEEKFIEAAADAQPDSKLINIGVETKRRQYRLEKLKLMPKAGFGFFADVGRTSGYVKGVQMTDDFNNPFNYSRAGVGLEFSGTLDFHGAFARIRKAKAEYMKASYEGAIAKRGIGLKVKEAYSNVKRMKADLARAKEMESLAQQMVFLSKMNIDSGIGDNQKYADALKYLLLARGQHYKSIFDFNLALAELEKQVGIEKYGQLSSTSAKGEEDFLQGERPSDIKYYQTNSVDMEGIHNEDN